MEHFWVRVLWYRVGHKWVHSRYSGAVHIQGDGESVHEAK